MAHVSIKCQLDIVVISIVSVHRAGILSQIWHVTSGRTVLSHLAFSVVIADLIYIKLLGDINCDESCHGLTRIYMACWKA